MTIHLDDDIFSIVKNGKKNVEVRVNDDKRRKLKIVDEITFLKRSNEDDQIKAIVTNLQYYNNFEELVKHYTIEQLYLKEYTKEDFVKLLERFYSKKE